jgi:uncharacterized membrane protein
MLSLRPMRLPWEELEPASRGAVERQRQAVRRVERLAAAAFAAAMALLVLLLAADTVSSLPEQATLPEALRMTWRTAVAGAVGFLALLSCWFLHHLEFHYLTRSSGGLLLLHTILLPAVLLVPLSAALHNTLSPTAHALLFFEVNVVTIQVVLLLTWRHAVKGGLLFGSDVPRRVVMRLRTILGSGVALLLGACVLSLVNTLASVVVLAAVLVAQIALVGIGGYTLEPGAGAGRKPGQ